MLVWFIPALNTGFTETLASIHSNCNGCQRAAYFNAEEIQCITVLFTQDIVWIYKLPCLA